MTDEAKKTEEEPYDEEALVWVEDIIIMFTYEIPDQDDLFAETWRIYINRRVRRGLIPSLVNQIKKTYAAENLYGFKWHHHEMILH